MPDNYLWQFVTFLPNTPPPPKKGPWSARADPSTLTTRQIGRRPDVQYGNLPMLIESTARARTIERKFSNLTEN